MEMGIDSAADVLVLAVQNKNSAVSTDKAPTIKISKEMVGIVMRLSVGVFVLFIFFLSLWFWKKNRARNDEHQADSAAPFSRPAEEYDDEVHLDKSMDDGGIDFYESIENDGVDLDKSMDDEAVGLCRSMDADFIKVTGARKFSYDDLVIATNNFLDQLGEGGFGAVYRGFLKDLNCYVAVKRISRDSRQGIKEYASEVKIISQLRHRNIVQLIGWCHETKELLLVYEFMPNCSLDSHLFKETSLLTWEVRYKIALGLALGLLYLHEEWEQYVVHRDIKASNVMLDSNFNAKLGDFGLAKLGYHGKGLDNTTIAGTIGYVAPEYATTGRPSKESDVYSFGCVALEIACGRRVIDLKARREDQINLREWVWNHYGGGKLLEAVDPRLNGEFDQQQMECLMVVGLWCVHPDAKLRPTIKKATHVLDFAAPLPDLPSEMPAVSYFAPFSMSFSGADFVESKNQSPKVDDSDFVLRFSEQAKFLGGFGALYKGIMKELKSSSFGMWKRSKGKKREIYFETAFGPRVFSYKDLVRATNNFSEKKKLGEGAFGQVYKGFLKELDSFVAVKRMSTKGSKQALKECESKVKIISRLRQRNLVQLIGLCRNKSELFLVYEFMPNGSLDSHLFGEDRVLAWDVRYKISQGLASALLYLHQDWLQCVLHRNIKSSKVLLDSEFNAKLGGFCLAKLLDHDKSPETTILVGTSGHIAPEFFTTAKVSRETDVYGFGIVALEIACGRKWMKIEASENHSFIVEWVWDLFRKGQLVEAADPRLFGDFDEQQMECLMLIGLWCAHPDATSRPSIRQVIEVLNFGAPWPPLPPFPPLMPKYFAASASSLSKSKSGSDLEESKCQFSGYITETTMSISPLKDLNCLGIPLASLIHTS